MAIYFEGWNPTLISAPHEIRNLGEEGCRLMEGRARAQTLQICIQLFHFVHDVCSHNSNTMFNIIVPILNRFYTHKTLGIASELLNIQSNRLRHYTLTRNANQYTISPWSVSQCCYLFNYALSNKTVSSSVCVVSNSGIISRLWTGKRGKVVVVATFERTWEESRKTSFSIGYLLIDFWIRYTQNTKQKH